MREPVALLFLPAIRRFRQLYSMNGSRGILATSTPRKQENNEAGETGLATKEMVDPIVDFSRPPPLPPFMGTLVVLSLLETWWNRGTDDDGK
ncbi:uncharacterized protein LOC113870182 [Abrus precatorius]|uniref:Uncharacterized protein LOC113870182 n=1 Tax=Abrus precatorius TaxID=3816 RepID=A0A8B8M224_ABRPR|nr:uncharacterized protein LOC113870182 [Abrus precatorius]